MTDEKPTALCFRGDPGKIVSMRVLILLLLTSCTAVAKPVPKAPQPAKVVQAEYVDFDDAHAALQAQAALQAAASELNVRQLAWQRARQRLIEKYGIDPDQGHGWEMEDATGKLKVRRAAPKVKK